MLCSVVRCSVVCCFYVVMLWYIPGRVGRSGAAHHLVLIVRCLEHPYVIYAHVRREVVTHPFV